MTKQIDKLTEFILMEKKDRMVLDAGYRRSYNFLARKRLNDIIEQIEIFSMGDTSFVQKQQLETFIRVAANFLKSMVGAKDVRIEVDL